MKKFDAFAVLVVALQLFKSILLEKQCIMSTVQLSCTFDPKIYGWLSVHKTDIKTLDLSGSLINELNRSSVNDYTNVVDLKLSNCRIRRIENETFTDLHKLTKLDLSDNLMAVFNTNSFEELNVLSVLILSNNLLSFLDNFRLDKFPKLKTLDVSGNYLKYLPQDLIIKLTNDPSFSIYVYQNPWNCNDTHWEALIRKSHHLKETFCELLYDFDRTSKYKSVANIENGLRAPETCNFIKCKWWIVGSIWIGIILGNVNKLNKLLYQSRCRKKKIRFFDKSVSTETDPHHQLRQDRVIFGLQQVEKQK